MFSFEHEKRLRRVKWRKFYEDLKQSHFAEVCKRLNGSRTNGLMVFVWFRCAVSQVLIIGQLQGAERQLPATVRKSYEISYLVRTFCAFNATAKNKKRNEKQFTMFSFFLLLAKQRRKKVNLVFNRSLRILFRVLSSPMISFQNKFQVWAMRGCFQGCPENSFKFHNNWIISSFRRSQIYRFRFHCCEVKKFSQSDVEFLVR